MQEILQNAAVENQHDVCEDLSLGKGKLIALHLKETKPGIFREVPFLTGHVQFEKSSTQHGAWVSAAT